MKSGNSQRLLLGTGGLLLLSTMLPAAAEVIAAWETTGQSNWGTQSLAPSFANPDLAVGGLTRGSGVSTNSNGVVANSWGGRGFNAADVEAALGNDDTISFSMTPGAGTQLTVESLVLNYRVSTDSGGVQTGPTEAMLFYKFDDGTIVEMEPVTFSDPSPAGATLTVVIKENYPEFEAIPAGTEVTFLIVPYGGTVSAGSLVFYGPMPGTDVTVNGVVDAGGIDDNPPLVVGLSPTDNSSDVPATTSILTMTFNENVALGTGQILVKNSLSGQNVYSLDVENSGQVTLSTNQIELALPNALDAGTDYHVEIPAGAIVDLASPANSYAGMSGSSIWNFTTAVVVTPPRVVVNKYVNGSPDRVELLVIGTGSPGSTVDLRGMILKDFSGDINGDAGGKFVFANTSFWSEVAAGTLVTLSNSSTSSDVAAGDYNLAVGLGDPSHFSLVPGSPALDITATDMVMIKDAGSNPAGTIGGIHALAAGATSPTSFFSLFQGAKLRATATTGANFGVVAANSSSTQTDYMSGTDATGNLPLALSDFGAPNNGPNAAYIAALRGRAPGDGDGIATVGNATLSSPFLGLPMFDDAQINQSAILEIAPRISEVTLSTVRIEVPSQIGAPGNVTLSGPGAAGASFSVTGQTIDITSASATTLSPLEVTISGLVTPSPVLASDNGNYPLVVSTSATGGTLTPIASQASVRVIVPISSLRDLDSEGVSLDTGSVVAVKGSVTEADFGGGAANFSGFLEDGTGGMNISSPSLFLGLTRGNVFAVVGTVSQINGLTSIVPSSASHLVNLQTVPEPTAQVVTLAVLNANPEAFEGKLVRVANLRFGSGIWGPGASVTLKDPNQIPVEIRIQSGSTANSAPAYPTDVTGIFGQSDDVSPFTSGYFLMPRDPNDLEPSTDDFQIWIDQTGATDGLAGDPDFDGKDNAFEYAFGQNPLSGTSAGPVVGGLNATSGKFTYTRRLLFLTELNYRIFTSTTLGSWTEDLNFTDSVISTQGSVETVEVTLSAPKPLTAPKLFIKVVAE